MNVEDVDKQVRYWISGALEDGAAAEQLVAGGKFRHGLFFAHLALEKALKGHVCRVRRETPPRIHNLVRLARLAEMELTQEQEVFLERMDLFNLVGRYPEEALIPVLDKDNAVSLLNKARETIQWLMRK